MNDRPLLICDADEVLVQFAGPLETYLEEQGYSIDFASFALNGNVRHRATGKNVDRKKVGALIDAFFEDRIEACLPVHGAVDALAQLAQRADIIVLTNIPSAQRERRENALALYGMPYRVITNEGPKGPAVRSLVDNRRIAAFVDDLPPHHRSVAHSAPHVHRLHLVSDLRLRPLLAPAEYAHARIDDWHLALPHLESVLL